MILVSLSQFAQARSYDDIIASNEITIAVYRDFPPYSFEQNGQAKGIDIHLANAIAHGLGVKLTLLWATPGETTADDLRMYLWKGNNLHTNDGTRVKADLMLRIPYDKNYAQMRDDQGLLVHEQVHMFAPYQQERWQIAYNPNKLEQIATMAVFQYHKVGVEINSAPQFYLTTAFNGRLRNNTKTYLDIRDAFAAMTQTNAVDAVMGIKSQIEWLHQQHPKQTHISQQTYPLFDTYKWDIGMAVGNDYRQLAYAIEDILLNQLKQQHLHQWATQFGVSYQQPELYQ